jgi:hypothetical protein
LAVLLPWACVLHLLGISVAIAAATIKIESIIASGIILSVLGLAIAIAGGIQRSPIVVLFGLSTCLLSAGVFLLIFLLSWSPGDARRPVPLILIGYEYLIFPVGLLIVHRHWGGRLLNEHCHRLQFGLRHLLVVTAVFAIASAAIRLALNGQALLAAICPGGVAVIAVVVMRWNRRRL